MNGEFEKNDAYPYSVAPEGGYSQGTGRHIIVDIRNGRQVGHESYETAAEASAEIARLKRDA